MSIPEKINNTTQRFNERYDSLMQCMASDIKDSSAMLAYFNWRSDWLVYPRLDEIQKFVSLQCTDSAEDGALYQASPDTMKDR